MSFGVECPSYGVYARVTKVKQWIQFIADGAMDSNCNQEVAYQPGGYVFIQIGLEPDKPKFLRFYHSEILFAALLITGGVRDPGGDHETPYSAEVIIPHANTTSCILPNLPSKRVQHTQSGWTACGGMDPGRHVSDD